MPADADHMTVWEAVPDMLNETQLSFIELNRQLTRLSVSLIGSNPDLYLRSVFGAWYSFWPVPNTWNREQIRGSGTRRALESIWTVEHAMLRAMNLALVVLALGLATRAAFRRFRDPRENLYLLIASVVLAASVVQALLEATDNARYSIPTQPLVGIFVIVLAFEYVRSWQARRRNIPAT
jgi:ABC-type Fe3+ transport system permease subunit